MRSSEKSGRRMSVKFYTKGIKNLVVNGKKLANICRIGIYSKILGQKIVSKTNFILKFGSSLPSLTDWTTEKLKLSLLLSRGSSICFKSRTKWPSLTNTLKTIKVLLLLFRLKTQNSLLLSLKSWWSHSRNCWIHPDRPYQI